MHKGKKSIMELMIIDDKLSMFPKTNRKRNLKTSSVLVSAFREDIKSSKLAVTKQKVRVLSFALQEVQPGLSILLK